MSIKLYAEGGGDSKCLRTQCRRGFRKSIEGAGLEDQILSDRAVCLRKNERRADRLAVLAPWVLAALIALLAQTAALAQVTDEVRSIRLRLEERSAAIRTAHLDSASTNVFFEDDLGYPSSPVPSACLLLTVGSLESFRRHSAS